MRAASHAERAAAIFRWRSGAWRSALDVLGRRIQKILKTCFALIHGARRRRLCFLMRITASLSNHQRNQPCSTAPAPRGLRTPLRAARFAACDAYQKPAAARQIYHGRKRDDVAEMHLERAAAVPGRRRGALRARWAVLASVAAPTGEPPAVRHTRCCAPQVTHHTHHTPRPISKSSTAHPPRPSADKPYFNHGRRGRDLRLLG